MASEGGGDAEKRICVVRPFRRGDEGAIKELMTEATMSTVKDFFWAAILSEIFPQVAILGLAFSFIVLNVPVYFCLGSIPLSIAVIYIVVWSGHMFKALQLHEDLSNIPGVYLKDSDSGFWVAEVYEECPPTEIESFINKKKGEPLNFMMEKELDSLQLNLDGYTKKIVGTVAICRSENGGLRAWLRRMAVKKEYRRQGIASQLLEEVITFCTDKCYEGIELITTECHNEARELYYKRGFEPEQTFYKTYLNVKQPLFLFYLQLKPKKANLEKISTS